METDGEKEQPKVELKEQKERRGALATLRKFWNWLWNSESWLSYLVFLAVVYVLIKFIFLPGLGLIFGTQLPLAIVESSSMDHSYLKYCLSYDSSSDSCVLWSSDYSLCGASSSERKFLNLDEYWQTCGAWYEKNANITQKQFSEFGFKNGFKKGDILVIINWREPKIGDVILAKPNAESLAPRPIIHRMIGENPIKTKGDHNEKQLTANNNIYRTDETSIGESRLMGIAVARVPYLGWAKLILVELAKKLF